MYRAVDLIGCAILSDPKVLFDDLVAVMCDLRLRDFTLNEPRCKFEPANFSLPYLFTSQLLLLLPQPLHLLHLLHTPFSTTSHYTFWPLALLINKWFFF